PDGERSQQLPFLAGMQVAEDVRQVPREGAVDLGVKEQGGGGGRSGREHERGRRAAEAGLVVRDVGGRGRRRTAAEVASDVDFVLREEAGNRLVHHEWPPVRSRILRTSVPASTGFGTWSSKPARRASSRSSGLAKPVMASAGKCRAVSLSRVRI